jgi:IPT/TIG domain
MRFNSCLLHRTVARDANRRRARAVITWACVFGAVILTTACRGGSTPTPVGRPPVGLSVRSIQPATGSIFGRTSVRIAGSGFEVGTTVRIADAISIVDVVVGSGNEEFIFVETPPHAAGPVDIVVASLAGQTVTMAGGFTYAPPVYQQFNDSRSGTNTPDVRDADDQIVRFTVDGFLVWAADETPLHGYRVRNNRYIDADFCRCTIEVRFGTRNSERQAFLTADYGHDNPETILNVELTGGVLTAERSTVYVPGTFLLTGVITEMTDAGPTPVEGVAVVVSTDTGWRSSLSDRNGSYQMAGLENTREVVVIDDRYQRVSAMVAINADTRFDIRVVRR